MRWRRRGAPGLRGRIVGAVLVTTVATLAVAALAVLGPLEHSLRTNALSSLRKELSGKNHELANFRSIDPTLLFQLDAANPSVRQQTLVQDELRNLTKFKLELARSLGVTAALVNLAALADGRVFLIPQPHDNDLVQTDTFRDAAEAFRAGHAQFTFGSINGTEYARAAVPIKTTDLGQSFVLTVRKPIDDIPEAVNVVRNAFLDAALAGLALTILLGIPLSARLARRLRRLRETALEVARSGPGVTVPVDRARDEVGDLARAFDTMQGRLRHQEEARRAFVATASHELRTPLTSLDGMLELLDDDLRAEHLDLEDARDLVLRARAQSRRLGRLAADLLDLSRIDAEVELRSEPVELGEIGRAVIAEFDLGVGERGLGLVLEDGEGPVWARGDPGGIARILRILLDNAVRVSPPGSTVRVSVRNGTRAELAVEDEGPGVPVHEREVIFERFQRGRDTGGKAGFGLGLAIGRELAERMGGTLVLEERDCAGACFKLSLPTATAPKVEPVAVA